eukprot:1158282-Pelagomonas_calceolata.AAC.8
MACSSVQAVQPPCEAGHHRNVWIFVSCGGCFASAKPARPADSRHACAVPYSGFVGAMEVLHQAVLRHVLEKEDDVLGPWLLGRDTAEDELHAFAAHLFGSEAMVPWPQSRTNDELQWFWTLGRKLDRLDMVERLACHGLARSDLIGPEISLVWMALRQA